MPRSESRTKTSIWESGNDFAKLTKDAQRMYWMIYSQPTITLCGVVALTERRWAQAAADETPEGVRAALEELEEQNYILVDWDTQEVLVRTFVHHDGIKPRSSVLPAAYGYLAHITSSALRAVARAQLEAIAPDPTPHPLSTACGALGDNGEADTPQEQLSTDKRTFSASRQLANASRQFSPEAPPVDKFHSESTGSAKPQVNPPSHTPSGTPPGTPSGTPWGTPSRATRASSSSSSTSSVKPTPNPGVTSPAAAAHGAGGGAPHRGKNPPSSSQLGLRMASACAGHASTTVSEAHAVVNWASCYVDLGLVEEAVGWAEGLAPEQRVALPRGVARTIQRMAARCGVGMPDFDPKGLKRR